MSRYKATNLVVISILVLTLSGCASLIMKPQSVILLPEERIFTVPAGTPIKVILDNKPMEMTFPNDMKLVSIEYLVKQENKVTNALFDKIKANKEKTATMGIVGSILAIVAGIFGIFRKKWWPNVKISGEVK